MPSKYFEIFGPLGPNSRGPNSIKGFNNSKKIDYHKIALKLLMKAS